MKKIRIAVSCGEKSGDLNTGNLIKTLNEKYSNLSFYGIGGENMEKAGCNIVYRSDGFGSIGIAESVKIFFRTFLVLIKFQKQTVKNRPDILLCVDFGYFNTKFIKDMAKHSPNTKIIYYFPPGSWRKKLKYQKSLGDAKAKVITPFPWSEKILNDYGIETKFLGHPLIETAKPAKSREEFYSQYSIKDNNKVLGFLPGSRNFEIKMHIEVFAETINRLYEENRDYIFLMSLGKDTEKWTAYLKKHCPSSFSNIKIIKNETYNIMAYSEFLFCCSGTATLESTIIGTPMVIIYKGNSIMEFEYFFRKKRISPVIGMPNLIMDRIIVPEYISHNVNSANLIKEYKNSVINREKIKKDLQTAKDILGKPPVLEKIAATFAQMTGIE